MDVQIYNTMTRREEAIRRQGYEVEDTPTGTRWRRAS
jgi:hypothetical protein